MSRVTEIDTNVPHPGRMYDYYLGGSTHFPVDRDAARKVLAVLPEGRDMAVANRAFLGRAVRFLADQGISQFLDIGTGIPAPGSTTDVARKASLAARVIAVDNDPIVVRYAPETVRADLRDPAALLGHRAIRTGLDFRRPMAVLLVAVLHFVRDSEDPEGVVNVVKDFMTAGSYLVVSHGTADFNPGRAAEAVRNYDSATAPFVLRTKDQIAAFFDGLEMVDPGLVQLPYWRPDSDPPVDPTRIWLYAGVGRK